jgi:hypothetical protein
MKKILDNGDAFFLIGGVVTSEGIRPVAFTRGISDYYASLVDELTPSIAAHIVEQVDALMESKQVTEH